MAELNRLINDIPITGDVDDDTFKEIAEKIDKLTEHIEKTNGAGVTFDLMKHFYVPSSYTVDTPNCHLKDFKEMVTEISQGNFYRLYNFKNVLLDCLIERNKLPCLRAYLYFIFSVEVLQIELTNETIERMKFWGQECKRFGKDIDKEVNKLLDAINKKDCKEFCEIYNDLYFNIDKPGWTDLSQDVISLYYLDTNCTGCEICKK